MFCPPHTRTYLDHLKPVLRRHKIYCVGYAMRCTSGCQRVQPLKKPNRYREGTQCVAHPVLCREPGFLFLFLHGPQSASVSLGSLVPSSSGPNAPPLQDSPSGQSGSGTEAMVPSPLWIRPCGSPTQRPVQSAPSPAHGARVAAVHPSRRTAAHFPFLPLPDGGGGAATAGLRRTSHTRRTVIRPSPPQRCTHHQSAVLHP